ncbi:MAG TPA: glycoside hydrolase family 43 protein [Verrucomicrobiae bacterium]|nr:glycoside hydrolase family 43 protein [Verrucomicrobiae bacterium]
MSTIHNPVLPGFHPDPSILRVEDDYYIANSTFEWFPGVPIHHSKDLVHWRLIGHALTRRSQLDLAGVADSAGIWAPSLSYRDGKFWLLYTIVRTRVGNFKDVHNYLVTAPEILGPWSEPIYLNSSGFDPSLFHDDDGRKWVVNVQWDFRKDHPRFQGIVLQEYDHEARKLVGPIHLIAQRKELIEGPNLYKTNGYYYLMLAEGGTGWNHGICLARARAITGPHEFDPRGSLLTARDNPSIELQKAGHGELVQTPMGEWYLVHLCSRPLSEARRCVLGRETAIQKVAWSGDGWLRLTANTTWPQIDVPAPKGAPIQAWPAEADRDEFDSPELTASWSSLRCPMDGSWLTLAERPGWLRLRGRESQHSLFEQSLIAKRLQDFRCAVETCCEFAPTHFTQMAGLICWYDTRMHYYLRITHDEQRGKVLGVVLTDDGRYDELGDSQISIADWTSCYLRVVIDRERLQFSASADGRNWRCIGPELDASKLSDDYGQGLHFTGTLIGLCVQDLRGARAAADFDYFEMKHGA